MKEKYDLDECFVFGHTGRFHYAKNHEFLLEAFGKIRKSWPHSAMGIPKLLLVGEGPLEEEMKELARKLKIEEDVIFAGRQGDIWKYYQCIDMILMPSRYEGLPGAIVEAQAAGVPSMISDTITRDVQATELVKYLPIDQGTELWEKEVIQWVGEVYPDPCEFIHEEMVQERRKRSVEAIVQLKKKGFDVKAQAVELAEFYENVSKK